MYEGKLWVLDAGAGSITCIKQDDEHIAQVAFCDYDDGPSRKECYDKQIGYAQELVRRWNGYPKLEKDNKALLNACDVLTGVMEGFIKECPTLADSFTFMSSLNEYKEIAKKAKAT